MRPPALPASGFAAHCRWLGRSLGAALGWAGRGRPPTPSKLGCLLHNPSVSSRAGGSLMTQAGSTSHSNHSTSRATTVTGVLTIGRGLCPGPPKPNEPITVPSPQSTRSTSSSFPDRIASHSRPPSSGGRLGVQLSNRLPLPVPCLSHNDAGLRRPELRARLASRRRPAPRRPRASGAHRTLAVLPATPSPAFHEYLP